MKPVSRAVPILLGFLVLCAVLFGNPPPSPALPTTIGVGDTVTFEFNYSGVTPPLDPSPTPYSVIRYFISLPPPWSIDNVFSATLSFFDELGSAAAYTTSVGPIASAGLGLVSSSFSGLFDDPISYMMVSLTSLSLLSNPGATSASFDVVGELGYSNGVVGPSATVSIASAPVPEPSTLLIAASGFATWGAMAWRRYRRG